MQQLETNRLLIRPFTMDDLEAAHQLLDHDLHWSGARFTMEQRRERLQREIYLAEWADTGKIFGYRAIVLKSTQGLIGICGLLPILHSPEAQRLFYPRLFEKSETSSTKFASFELEIGYAIATKRQKQGYASEAILGLLKYAFDELNVKRIFASTNRKNAASIALMKRVGMRIAHNPERLDEDWPDAPGVLGVIEHSAL